MKLKELTSFLDSAVPLSFQENYDNSGIQTGLPESEISAGLLTIDITEDVVDEAVREECNIIISHHPLIFSGLKKITGVDPVEKILIKCIKNDIAVYSSHTNLDIYGSYVSRKLAEKIGLKNIQPLIPLEKKLLKLITYVPDSHLEKVRNAVFMAGAGVIGNYDYCGFTVAGTGSFRAGENTNPFIGEIGEMHLEKEIRFETVLFSHLKSKVVDALISSHPYEEVAYDLYQLENTNTGSGLGCTGDFDNPLSTDAFLELVAEVTGSRHPRYSRKTRGEIKKVAICGGAGGQFLQNAVSAGADAFITGDVRYHVFLEAEDKILLVDAGHYETEKFATEILKELIIKKFPTFALRFSKTITNAINYL